MTFILTKEWQFNAENDYGVYTVLRKKNDKYYFPETPTECDIDGIQTCHLSKPSSYKINPYGEITIHDSEGNSYMWSPYLPIRSGVTPKLEVVAGPDAKMVVSGFVSFRDIKCALLYRDALVALHGENDGKHVIMYGMIPIGTLFYQGYQNKPEFEALKGNMLCVACEEDEYNTNKEYQSSLGVC